MPRNDDRLVTTQEAAEVLAINPRTLANWRSAQRSPLPFVKVGGLVRYRLSALHEFIQRQTVEVSN